MSAFDTELRALLATPARAQQILTAVASALRSECAFEPLTLDTVSLYFRGAALVLTDGLPTVIADDIIRRTARALPTIHPGETPDAYALRLLHIAKGI